jgi:hypothetical protein
MAYLLDQPERAFAESWFAESRLGAGGMGPFLSFRHPTSPCDPTATIPGRQLISPTPPVHHLEPR